MGEYNVLEWFVLFIYIIVILEKIHMSIILLDGFGQESYEI